MSESRHGMTALGPGDLDMILNLVDIIGRSVNSRMIAFVFMAADGCTDIALLEPDQATVELALRRAVRILRENAEREGKS